MNRKINALLLAFLMSVQPTMSYSSDKIDYEMMLSVIVSVSSTIISACIIVFISKIMMRPDEKFKPISVKERLKDYAGKIPKSVIDLIKQLKNLTPYQEINASITKGILLHGDPGCGKTHLARVIAGEVDCPFFETNAPSFSQNLVGNARTIVENLFITARKAAQKHASKTAIIFIDELDSIGSRDANNPSMTNTEIINTLLREMDGFDNKKEHIVVIAATNHIDSLDSALIRAGRFDQKIYIPIPSKKARVKIIDYYLQQCPHEDDITVTSLVSVTKGMTPADIKELFNEAGVRAIDDSKKRRDKKCFVLACYDIQKSKQQQQIAPRYKREKYIRSIITTRIPGLSIEDCCKSTKGMSLNNVDQTFTRACQEAQKSGTVISSAMIIEASCAVKREMKKNNKINKIKIAQKIYQIDKQKVKRWKEDKDLLQLTSAMIMDECKQL